MWLLQLAAPSPHAADYWQLCIVDAAALCKAQHAWQEAELEIAGLQALQRQARDGFAAVVSYFGENVNSYATDSDFWAGLTAFVASFSAAQADILTKMQVYMPALGLHSCRALTHHHSLMVCLACDMCTPLRPAAEAACKLQCFGM